MAMDLLPALRDLLKDLLALELSADGLRGFLDLRYGVVPLHIDYDREAEGMRVCVRIPTPPATGAEFLLWCLVTNGRYWDAKIAIDEEGYLLIHADMDAPPRPDLEVLHTALSDRIDTIAELIDDDLCEYLLQRGLGTPEQLARWQDQGEVDSEA